MATHKPIHELISSARDLSGLNSHEPGQVHNMIGVNEPSISQEANNSFDMSGMSPTPTLDI